MYSNGVVLISCCVVLLLGGLLECHRLDCVLLPCGVDSASRIFCRCAFCLQMSECGSRMQGKPCACVSRCFMEQCTAAHTVTAIWNSVTLANIQIPNGQAATSVISRTVFASQAMAESVGRITVSFSGLSACMYNAWRHRTTTHLRPWLVVLTIWSCQGRNTIRPVNWHLHSPIDLQPQPVA